MHAHGALQLVWTQAWQVAVVAVLVLAAARIWGRKRPHLAHAFWLVVLCKCLTPPLLASPVGIFCWLEPIRTMSRSDVTTYAPASVGGRVPREFSRLDHVVELRRDRKEDEPAEAQQRAMPRELVESLNRAITSLGHWFDRGWLVAALIGIWTCGVAARLIVLASRWAVYSRHLRRRRVAAPAPLTARAIRLSRQLKLRRSVRLIVTDSPLGPAVIGLRRPTIVLPTLLTDRLSADDLEPILAHELLHVRRGDLWISFLQAICGAGWWFHPLVALASRRLAHEAERCCDEEVLAELRCAPARYARGLLSVLELKQTLLAAPTFPGVRAVDLTSQRLERIMTLGQRCRRRTPWWCWAAMLLLAAVVLPGASLVVAAGDRCTDDLSPTSDSPQQVEGSVAGRGVGAASADPPLVSPVDGDAATGSATAWRWNASANVSELLSTIRNDRQFDEAAARRFLLSQLYNRVSARIAQQTPPDAAAAWHLHEITTEGLVIGSKDSTENERWRISLDASATLRVQPAAMAVSDESRVAEGNSLAALRYIEQALSEMREFGFRSVELTVRFITGPADLIEGASSAWTLTAGPDAANSDGARADENQPLDPLSAMPKWAPPGVASSQATHAHVAIEQDVPVLFDVIDSTSSAALVDRLSGHRRINVLQAPRLAMYSGQSASVADVTQTPFVVGVREVGDPLAVALKPQIRIVRSGLWLHARPVVRDDVVHLDFEFTLAGIKDVESQQVPTKAGPTEVQIPVVAHARFQSSVELPLGKTLLVGGLMRSDVQGKEESVLVLVSAREAIGDVRDANQKQVEPADDASNSDAGGVDEVDALSAEPAASATQAERDREVQAAQTAFNRRAAAKCNLDAVEAAYRAGKVELDLLLDSQRRMADSELNAAQYEADATDSSNATNHAVTVAKRKLDILCRARDRALKTWRSVYLLYVSGANGGASQKELQSREQYFLFRQQVETALSAYNAVGGP